MSRSLSASGPPDLLDRPISSPPMGGYNNFRSVTIGARLVLPFLGFHTPLNINVVTFAKILLGVLNRILV